MLALLATLSHSLMRPRGYFRELSHRDFPISTFDQKIDHAHPEIGVFTQRYIEEKKYNKNNEVVFLCIGGESDGFYPYGVNDFVEELAQEQNAIILTLEHRYFGESHPFENTSTPLLQFLTVQNAIDDLANFRNYYAQKNQIPDNATWILFGGSYPGLLSAFTRSQYPNLFKGAIASSGVVLASNDYKEFDLQIAISLGQECAAVARNARRRIDELLESDDRDWLLQQFDASNVEVDVFRFVVGEMFSLAPQYGYRNQVCGPLLDSLTSGSDPVMALAKYAREFFIPKFCGGSIYETYSTARMQSISKINAGSRMWLWMTCNELAYWQVSPGRLGLRSSKVDQAFFSKQCKDVFGIEMFPDTDAFNEKYHGLKQDATNVYYTTGSQDPWTPVCITDQETVPSGSYAHTITGPEVGHCSDLHASKESDPVDLKRTHAHIKKIIDNWIHE